MFAAKSAEEILENFLNKKFLHATVFFLALVFGTLIRLYLATLGHNHDVFVWQHIGEIVSQGKDVFVDSHRWPYAPFLVYFFAFVYQLNQILPFSHVESFHIWVAFFLSLVDLLIAHHLFKKYSIKVALFFFMSPVGFLITGYHSQIDNVAVMLALLGWSLLYFKPTCNKTFTGGVILFGLSLLSKHVFLLFPFWVIFFDKFTLRKKIIFFIGVYGIFLLSFMPYLLDEYSRVRVIEIVGKYQHRTGNSLVGIVLDVLVPLEILSRHIGLPLILKTIMGIATILVGIRVMKTQPQNAIFLYVLAIVVFSSQMADQYFAIPLIACAFFYRSCFSWFYMLSATFLILISYDNVRFIHNFAPNSELLKLSHVHWGGVWQYWHSQIWLTLLLIQVIFFHQKIVCENPE